MAAPAVPFYGKDTDRLAMLNIAHKTLAETESFLNNWPSTVASREVFKQKIDAYQSTYEAALHGDRRAIAARTAAANDAGATWQKIVNYACATEQDHTDMLERMGVITKSRRSGSAHAAAGLQPPEFAIVNMDLRGGVRASCPRERRRYTHEVWVTEGDPRLEEGWYLKQSFGDCSNMEMTGFQSGKEYSFRCRIIGRDNNPSPWSHTITIMVT